MFKRQKGFVLIAFYLIVVVLIILAVAYFSRSTSETRLAQRERSFVQALYLAEAGIDFALIQLRSGASSGDPLETGVGEIGSYDCDWALKPGETSIWLINSSGIAEDATRRIQAEVEKKDLPPEFFENALYSSGDVDLNGSAYEVNGDIIYADELEGNPDNVNGSLSQDSSVSPLVALNFAELRAISEGQGNVYDAFRLSTDPLPSSFWYDEALGIPNIVYVETDLTLNGNVGTVGGFFVVVGDVLTDPSGSNDTTINGNGQIDGCIYTTGEFKVNGGGGGLNVNGGVWAGEEIRLNGNANITFNQIYMDALESLSMSTDYQLISWQEL